MPASTTTRNLLIALAAVVIVFIVWNTPALNGVLYPFRLFVTYVHEAGHGTAALLTGGRFVGFEVFPNGAGQALTAGGSRLLILPAGYLGTALFGAALFYLANRTRYTRGVAFALGIGLLVFSVLFGRFSLTAFLVGLAFGLALLGLGWKASRDINALVLNILAILTGLNAVLDLWFLIGDSGAMLGDLRNDAAAFAAEVAPLIPAWVWALLWALMAVVMLGLSVWRSVIRPLSKPINPPT
jgi:hypothetical protein